MTTQPTPAPWKLTIEPTRLPGIIRASIEAAEGTYRGSIAYLQNVDWDGGIGPDEMTANAHLLSAAHDMFAALMPFADIGIGENPDYQPMIRMDRAAIVSARAALAKARGQA